MLKNFRKSFKKGVQNSMLFGYKIWQLENWAENDDFLPVKRILLSFPQFLSVWAVILHEVQQCTRNVFHQFDQHPQMLRKKYFFLRRSESKKIPTKKMIQFDVFFLSLFGYWSNWWTKFCVHC